MSFSLIPQMLLPGYGSLTPEMLRERGIRLLLCDLDYTLAPKYVPGPDEALHRWLAAMGEAGIRVMILSNNRSPVRVERFCRDLGIDYVGHAGKPSPRGFRAAMEKAGVTQIDVCPDCTACRPDLYWSHRRMGQARGAQIAMICL